MAVVEAWLGWVGWIVVTPPARGYERGEHVEALEGERKAVERLVANMGFAVQMWRCCGWFVPVKEQPNFLLFGLGEYQ